MINRKINDVISRVCVPIYIVYIVLSFHYYFGTTIIVIQIKYFDEKALVTNRLTAMLVSKLKNSIKQEIKRQPTTDEGRILKL